MTNKEKVIKGLEVCRDQNNPPGYRFTSCVDDCPYHGNGCARKLKDDAIALLKEDCHNCKLECLLQKYDELKEKYDSLLKEQNKKQIKIHKCHVITLKRHDEFSMRKLYESICETLLDEGNLKIMRTDDHEKVEFVWEIEQKEQT